MGSTGLPKIIRHHDAVLAAFGIQFKLCMDCDNPETIPVTRCCYLCLGLCCPRCMKNTICNRCQRNAKIPGNNLLQRALAYYKR